MPLLRPTLLCLATLPLAAQTPQKLPVTHVSLYKNGVGFFEHTARLTGDQTLSLALTSAQLNDVLQTLTAIDLNGGTVTGANFNSTTPLAQQLGNLPLSLGENPTEADLYTTLRGARVEVLGSGPAFTGRILALEDRPALADRPTPPATDDTSPRQPVATQRLLTVISDTGTTRTLRLTPTTTVHLLEPTLRTDLNTYLALLDTNRSEGIRRLALTDRGSGTRTLQVSFLAEVPVWKSTYRLLLTTSPSSPATTATLQGFSVVDNTTGEDWTDVQLSLIAGSPQSFLQPLAQPIYSRRPEVPIAQNAQLTPQTHDSGIDNQPLDGRQGAGIAGMSGGAAGGVPGDVLGGIGSAPAPIVMTEQGRALGQGSGSAIGGGSRRVYSHGATTFAIPYETLARDSNTTQATTATFDNFFSYTLPNLVTIPRNGSALVPILQQSLPVQTVTLWSPAEPTPLRALWLTNTSKLTLDQGSFTVLEDGNFAGEGLTTVVHPGERRLLSFAADQAVRVSVDYRHDTERITSIAVAEGILRATRSEIAEVEYLVHNAAPEPRDVLIEEPRRPGWTLDSTDGRSSDPKPVETTPTAYRFRVLTASGETVRLHLGQTHTVEQHFRLADPNQTSESQLALYLQNGSATPAILQQLQPLFAARRRVDTLDTEITDKQQSIDTIVADQKRLRDNLAALHGGNEERALARRYTAELNTQEDTLATLRRDLATLQQQRTTANTDLQQLITTLQITP